MSIPKTVYDNAWVGQPPAQGARMPHTEEAWAALWETFHAKDSSSSHKTAVATYQNQQTAIAFALK